ncbi:MAG: GNAT family N-acetyltransferase [Bacteroidota bacterium]
MIKIEPLISLDPETIFNAFSDAFSDYEMQLDRKELEAMLQRRGFVPALSFGAFYKGELVSFTFNGIGNYNGIKTAYDTGTGTIREFRGRGLATRVFKDSVPFLKEAGIDRYLLEVLQHNRGAFSVYRKLGFEITREFNYFSSALDEVRIPENESVEFPEIRPVDLHAREEMKKFWDFTPSWQNDFGSIERSLEDFKMIGAFSRGKMAGYAIFAPHSGDLTQIAVEKSLRRKGIATAMLKVILKEIRHTSVKLINAERGCDSITGFLNSFSILPAGTQFEMQKIL